MALDKLLSDSIDARFFEGKVSLETETPRPDGKIVVQRKGTLTLLEEWLLQEIIWDDPVAFREVVIQPLREVRRLRQAPAHTFTSDAFSEDYYIKGASSVCGAVSTASPTFAGRSRDTRKPPVVDIPDWLDEGRIDVF